MKKLFTFALLSLTGFTFAADLYMAGDSTMQTYAKKVYPQEGWGQRMQALVKEGVKVHNKSIGGRSTKSFKDQGRWEKLVDEVKKGDFVIIQFGHNDGTKDKPERYASPADYRENLKGFIADVRAKEGIPVLVTSIPFGSFKDGKVNPARFLAAYVNAMCEVAKETGCDLINLNEYAMKKFDELGEEKVMPFYLVFGPEAYPNYPKGRKDHCHISDQGALFYAEAVVEIAKAKNLPIAGIFK